MVRHYERKTNKCCWEQSNLNRAIAAVENGEMSQAEAAREYSIPKSTLNDRLKNQNFKKPINGRKPVFSVEMENQLKNHVIAMSNVYFGLTAKGLKKLAFQFAEELKISHPFNKEKQTAGDDWLSSFLFRHKELSVRTPEATSLNRIKGFNKMEVDRFFDNLRSVIAQNNVPEGRIYNVDETGVTTVHRLEKIVTQKGRKQVGKAVSGERGSSTTVIACVSATGNYLPPLFVFKRKLRDDRLIAGAPAGAVYEVSDSGWSNEKIFLRWLEHFKTNTGASNENKVILILDNHESHCSLPIWKFCKANGILMVSIPPHSSHRIQPLDLTIFGPLKRAFYQQCEFFMSTRNCKITTYNIAALFTPAFNKIASVDKAVNGFKASGIWPFDPNTFSDDCFQPTEVQLETEPETNGRTLVTETLGRTSQQLSEIDQGPSTSQQGLETIFKTTLTKLSPIPVVKQSKKRGGRPRGHSEILTSTPKKVEMEQRALEKIKKKGLVKRKIENDRIPNAKKEKMSGITHKKMKFAIPLKKKGQRKLFDKGQDYFCIYCDEKYVDPPTEDWIQCVICSNWCHEKCALDKEIKKAFICNNCH